MPNCCFLTCLLDLRARPSQVARGSKWLRNIREQTRSARSYYEANRDTILSEMSRLSIIAPCEPPTCKNKPNIRTLRTSALQLTTFCYLEPCSDRHCDIPLHFPKISYRKFSLHSLIPFLDDRRLSRSTPREAAVGDFIRLVRRRDPDGSSSGCCYELQTAVTSYAQGDFVVRVAPKISLCSS